MQVPIDWNSEVCPPDGIEAVYPMAGLCLIVSMPASTQHEPGAGAYMA